MNQLTETITNQNHEIQQSVNLMNQYLMAPKDDEKKNRNTDDRLLDENHIATKIAQNVNSVISGEVEYAIKEEINGNVLPCKFTFSTMFLITHLYCFKLYRVLGNGLAVLKGVI